MSPGVREALLSLLSNGPIIRIRDVYSRGACLICCCRQQRENTRGFWLLSAQDPSTRQQFVFTGTNKSYVPDFRENRFCVRWFHLWCMRWPAYDRARSPTVSGAIGAEYAR